MKQLAADITEKTIALARMLFQFGLVTRVIHHEDGVTRETDTTHSVMLGVMACAFAKEYAPHLDRGKIAEYALVHDLVEVYAGDTVTFGKRGEDPDKAVREAAALARIKEEHDAAFPWVSETIEEYESLKTPEARYIKVFDKVLPKIGHLLNKGQTVRELNHDTESMTEFHEYQQEKLLKSYGADQPEVMELFRLIKEEANRVLTT